MKRFKMPDRRRVVVNDLDPFTLESSSIPAPGEVVFAEAGDLLPAGHVYKFRAEELVKYVMSSGRILNPFTRDQLPQQTLFDAALICARKYPKTWDKLQAIAISTPDVSGRTLLGIVAREVSRREAEIANRIAAAQVLEDNLRSIAQTVVTSIFRVDRSIRPFRVQNPQIQAEFERLPQIGRIPHPEPTTPLSSSGPSVSFVEYPGSRSPMTPDQWPSADANSWAEDWVRMDRALESAGISQEQFTNGLNSMISGFTYLRQASLPRFSRLIRAFVQWLRFILRSTNDTIGPAAREIARRVTWITIARGLPLAIPPSEVTHAIRFNENEFHSARQDYSVGERLIDSLLLRASIVFR